MFCVQACVFLAAHLSVSVEPKNKITVLSTHFKIFMLFCHVFGVFGLYIASQATTKVLLSIHANPSSKSVIKSLCL